MNSTRVSRETRAWVQRGSQERRVVNDEKLVVSSRPHVELERLRALLQREVVGGEGVFASISGCSAVSDHLRGRRRSHLHAADASGRKLSRCCAAVTPM